MGTPLAHDLERLCREHGAIALYVFGSRAMEIAARARGGEERPERGSSDVDIGLLMPRDGSLDERERVRLTAGIEDLLGVERVDLVVLGEASSFLAADVVSGELLVDVSPRETAEFELFALRRAGDLLPFQRSRVSAVIDEGGR
jgi:predicted nucleotidyltransferase